MDLNRMIKELMDGPESRGIGMIASHLGVVRGHSRDGRRVTRVRVQYDRDALQRILQEIKNLKGVVDAKIDIREGDLEVGDEILAVAVAGDIRENVFPALMEAVNRIKSEAAAKQEFSD